MGGADVGALQQLLLESGFSITARELEGSRFGPSTLAALRAFQARHVDAKGRPLVEDGVAGPATWSSLLNPEGETTRFVSPGWRADLMSVRLEARKPVLAAIAEIGVREDTPAWNRGTVIDEYTGMVGRPAQEKGPPWCAYFVSWALSHAEHGLAFGHPLASAYKIHHWAEMNRALLRRDEPALAGDVAVMLRGDLHGHVELIIGNALDGNLALVGGNVGNAVRGTVRPRSMLTAVVRAIPLSTRQ
jgi:hypothetical protein